VNETCTNGGPSDQCKDSMSNCSGDPEDYKCTCKDEYYNSGGTCTNRKYFSIFIKIITFPHLPVLYIVVEHGVCYC